MAGFFSKILGAFSGGDAASVAAGKEHMRKIGEYTVFATPRREGSQYRLAGRIEHEVNGEKQIRNFVRADVFASEDDTVETTFRKATQIIEQNPGLFADGEKERQV